MLLGLARQLGKGRAINGMALLAFIEFQILRQPLAALHQPLLGHRRYRGLGMIHPLPNLPLLLFAHHNTTPLPYFMPESEKCSKKDFHFSFICAIMRKTMDTGGTIMARTSNKADLILDYVNQFIQENGYAPSVREIGAAVGLRSTASVSYHLQALQDKGLLQSPKGKGMKRAIVTSQRPGQIPVIGVVTAGVPILAFENQEGTMAWDGDPSCFALRVRGDSMINAGILSGDKVVVRPQQTAQDGQIVVARIGDEATVKRLRLRRGQVWLMPENDNYDPIDGSEAEIIGLVKAVVREY